MPYPSNIIFIIINVDKSEKDSMIIHANPVSFFPN